MQYLLLIYGNESQWKALSEIERAGMYQEFGRFTESLQQNGQYIGGSQLMPTATAATVRERDGRQSVTDGPFAETKEQLGGYYLVEAAGQEEAVAIAARIPAVRWGSIEVRALVASAARTAS